MGETDGTTLSWCNKHKEWWVDACPDCMAETCDAECQERVERIKKEIEDSYIECRFLDNDIGVRAVPDYKLEAIWEEEGVK